MHATPRLGNLPNDPAYHLLKDDFQSTPKVHRPGCYICEDMEFARMGLPLCSPCCQCRTKNQDGHIAADDGTCDDCEHESCKACWDLAPSEQEICTCSTPCCEADIGVGIITCESKHCPTHGITKEK